MPDRKPERNQECACFVKKSAKIDLKMKTPLEFFSGVFCTFLLIAPHYFAAVSMVAPSILSIASTLEKPAC